MTTKELTTIHDRLADIACITKGFKLAVEAQSGGNKKQREALLEFCNYIQDNLRTSKQLLRANISKQ